MGTVRYVHPTQGPYFTVQAAHDAAAAGDTVLVSPAHTSTTALNWTKRVHLKGDTQAPDSTPVVVGGIDLEGLKPLGSAATVFFEGLTIAATASTWSGIYHPLVIGFRGSPSDWANGPELIFNRCRFGYAPYGLSGWYGVKNGRFHFRNCDFNYQHVSTQGYLWQNFCPSDGKSDQAFRTMNIVNCRIGPNAVPLPGTEEYWAAIYLDAVVNATPGYGAGYGQWYAEQFQGQAYRAYGQIILPQGVDRSTARVRLYRVVNGEIDLIPWLVFVPDPVTGNWEHQYLPTDQVYWAATIPPAGYRPQWDGPFIPAT